MKDRTFLPSGRKFERELFGGAGDMEDIPPYLDFTSAMNKVRESFLWRPNRESGTYETYDPFNPKWGHLHELWTEVYKRLPKRSSGVRSGPLSLHVAINTPLDYWHGVDAFFWWMGVYLTIDASQVSKGKEKKGKRHLKADLLVTPADLNPTRLASLGEYIANFLKEKRRVTRKVEQKKRGLGDKIVPFG